MNMMYQDHLKTCGYCQNQKQNDRKAKLHELGHMIKGTRGASSSDVTTTGSYPNINDQLRKTKLRVSQLRAMVNERNCLNLVLSLKGFHILVWNLYSKPKLKELLELQQQESQDLLKGKLN